jgi:hypothetical protein
LELGHHNLALNSELLGELVDPDLGHISPVSVRPDRTDRRYSWGALIAARSSLRAHRVLLIAVDPLPALTVLALDISNSKYARSGARSSGPE